MTVYYVDPENGNDSNDGQSFANRKKWWDEVNLNDGDEIRFIKSPDPTSLGNGSWESDSTYNSEEPDTSNRSIGSCTVDGQASGSPTTVAKTSHGLSTGDAVYIADTSYTYAGVHQVTVTDANNFTLDGTSNAADTSSTSETIYKLNPFCVRLASSPIKNIICHQGLDGGGDKDWTAVSGSTFRESTNYQSGYKSARGFKPGNDATGKVAYVQLDNALDLSGYQQISLKYFWDYIPSGQKNDADIFSLRLCSDTGGDTTVHTVPINPPPGDDSDRWGWYTHDFGTNLNSSIQSIALHADVETEHNNIEIQIDNVIACKAKSSADSLHLGSLIGKGNTQTSEWHAILAIVDKIVILDNYWHTHDGLSVEPRPYVGSSETVTTYKRECFTKPEMYNSIEDYGTDTFHVDNEDNITASGGWNTTDMSSQDTNAGTWLGHHSSMYNSLYIENCHNFSASDFGFVRGALGAGETTTSIESYSHQLTTFTRCQFILNKDGPKVNNRTLFDNCTFDSIYNLFENQRFNIIAKNCTFNNCSIEANNAYYRKIFIGCTLKGTGNYLGRLLLNSGLAGPTWGSHLEFHNCTLDMMRFAHGEDWQHHITCTNCTIGSNFSVFDTDIDYDQVFAQDDKPQIAFINYNDTANDHRLYYAHYLVTSDSSVTQSGSGYSWKFDPLSTVTHKKRIKDFPLYFKLAEVAVAANAQVTASVYVRKSSYTNSNDDIGLAALLEDNGSIGLTSDVKVYNTTSNTDTWEQLTLTFTPTIAGVATIRALISDEGDSAYKWVDTLSISQA